MGDVAERLWPYRCLKCNHQWRSANISPAACPGCSL